MEAAGKVRVGISQSLDELLLLFHTEVFDPGTKLWSIVDPTGFNLPMGSFMNQCGSIRTHEEFLVVFGGLLQEIDAAPPGGVMILGRSANGECFIADPSEPPADASIPGRVGGLEELQGCQHDLRETG